MKLLLDQNLSFRLAKKLNTVFGHCVHVSDVGLENHEDRNIFGFAKKRGYTIITFDTDFYELGILKGSPPKIIWLRGSNQHSANILNRLLEQEARIKAFIKGETQQHESCLEVAL